MSRMIGRPVKYLPEWFPGAKFQIEAKEWSKSVLGMPKLPFEFVKTSMVWLRLLVRFLVSR
jgi:hypothetical protein